MRLPKPSAPFSPVCVVGESITVDTAGKVLVLPSGNSAVLPSFNEYVLNPTRLTVAESPFGGLKGSGSPDYAVGTLNIIEGDGVYLTDTSGTNSTKTLSAGKLSELGLLIVDTAAHTITEEFIVANTGDNNPTVIYSCDSTTGWAFVLGSGVLTVENGRLKCAGNAGASGMILISRSVGTTLSDKTFMSETVEFNLATPVRLSVANSEQTWSKIWSDSRFSLQPNQSTRFVLPIKAPAGTTGALPTVVTGTPNLADNILLYIGASGLQINQSVTFYIDNITADTGKTAYIELQTPNNLAPSSFTLRTHNGTAYNTACRVDSLDGAYSNVSATSANCTFADGTLLDHVFGTGLGRVVFPKGASGATVNGSIGAMTYSANQGTSKRIGLKVDLPPSDGGRTNFNKIRLKTILTYAPDTEDNYSASYDFADSTNTSYGLQNISKPWIALYDPASSEIDFYLFTHRPKNLTFNRDETGKIYELTLYPGNGLIYHGRVTHCNPTLDTNSNLIPNCLEPDVEGSVQKFLQAYNYAEDWFTEYDLSTSAIVQNDFSISESSLDIIPFVTSAGDSVSNSENVALPVIETIPTATGDVSVYDVRGLSTVKVRDTPYTNAGDCKVFDTVTAGNTTESTWVRVYDTAYSFTGDRVIENGMFRLILTAGSPLKCYVFNGTQYIYATDDMSSAVVVLVGGGASIATSITYVFTQISSSRIAVAVTAKNTGETITSTSDISITRGAYLVNVDGDTSSLMLYFSDGGDGNLVCIGSNVYDEDLSNDGMSLINQYYPLFSISRLGHRAIPVIIDSGGDYFCSLAYGFGAQSPPYRIGAIPYSSQMYWEAESGSLINGATYYTGVDCYPGSGNTGITLSNENAYTIYPCMNVLEAGKKYTIFIRAKQTAGSEPLTLRFAAAPYTAVKIFTLPAYGATFSTQSVDYTPTATEVSQIVTFRPVVLNNGNAFVVDYILIVPTGLIEKHAKRALWNASPMTKQLKSSTR